MLSLTLEQKTIVEKYFIIEQFDAEIAVYNDYYLCKEDLVDVVHVVDCVVCGAITNLEKVLAHTIWHESLVYKRYD